MFERVLYRVIENLPERLEQRTRPHPPLLTALKGRFTALYAIDGTTLAALFRKLKSLQDAPDAPLAGHLIAAVDLFTHLPAKLWFFEDPATNDKAVIPALLAWLQPGSLVVFDLGYFSFPFFDSLTDLKSSFVTRLRAKTSYTVERILIETPQVRDRIVKLGEYRSNPSTHPVRLIEVFLNNRWHSYVTNVLDPQQLSIEEVVLLYERRWHIETAFRLVKRLLSLAYLWVGSLNGVQLQVWATVLFYAILIDLCDDVADHLQLPLERISVEMVFRSLYYYALAVANGYTKSAPEYFVEDGDGLGIVKRPRSGTSPPLAEQVRPALAYSAPPSHLEATAH